MPPKKSKRKRKVVKETFIHRKIYEFLRGKDISDREEKYANHIKNIKESRNHLEASHSAVAQLQEKVFSENKWREYVKCSPLPKAYVPPDIRLLIEKLKYFENISAEENTMSWRLLIDDHSILTQDFSREDLTHSALKQKNKPKIFSQLYEKCIEMCLKILRRIEDYLANNTEIATCDVDKLHDIRDLRITLRHEIVDFLNRLTYHILSSEDANMNSLDALTSDYNFQSDDFKIHIWALKNVPIRFQQFENTRFIAHLHGINVILSIPISVMKENFVIRGILMNFDHISDNDQVYFHLADVSPSNGIFTETDLSECLQKEWLMQLEIMDRVRNELLQTRQEYENQVQLLQDDYTKKKKKWTEEEIVRISQKKALKLLGLKAEPEIIDEGTYPDIHEDFLQEEQMQYENYFNAKYSPESLNLDADEINLKKYFILGGIYQLYQVEKPQHIEFNNFNMTWHLNNSKLVVNEDLEISLDQMPQQRRSTIFLKEPRKTLTITSYDLNVKPEPESPWFILTIQLPEYLCYWGQPVVCQYETLTKTKTIPVVEETKKEHSVVETADKHLPFLAPQEEGLTSSVLKLQQVSNDSFFRTSISNVHVAQDMLPTKEHVHDLGDILNIADFSLAAVLSKSQIRQIQRHVLPRMISSFKFNKDIREDELAAAIQSKGKTRAGNIILKRADENIKEILEDEHVFSVGPMQNNPERLIPIYVRNEPIRLCQLEGDLKHTNLINEGVKTFAQLVKLINFIKWWHKARIRKIIDLKHFTPSSPVVNKRLKALRKTKLKTLFSVTSMPSSTISKSRSKIADSRSVSKTTFIEPSVSDISSTMMMDSTSGIDFSSFKDSTSKTHSVDSDPDELIENLQAYSCSHWTTLSIFKTEFNREMQNVVFQTNRLGIFGLAFKQYEHFPFKSWQLEPSENDPENEIIFNLETQHVICNFYITENGIRCRITDPAAKLTRKSKFYLSIDEPISDLKELKQLFQQRNLNIFADIDASFYIENGYFSEKHLATELHTYDCMALNSTQMKFLACQWNRLAHRRDIILKFLQIGDFEENTVDVRITPEEAYFVEIHELCSNDLNEIKLNYNLTWRNIGILSDLNQLINSMYPTEKEMKCKNVKLLNFLRNLLYEIRPLSFS